MESTDRQILTLLATDGRMSYTEFGEGKRPEDGSPWRRVFGQAPDGKNPRHATGSKVALAKFGGRQIGFGPGDMRPDGAERKRASGQGGEPGGRT